MGVFEAPSVLCASLKERLPFAPLVCGIARALSQIVSARQTTKGECQKERRKPLFPVTAVAINPSLIESNLYGSLLMNDEWDYRIWPFCIERFPLSQTKRAT